MKKNNIQENGSTYNNLERSNAYFCVCAKDLVDNLSVKLIEFNFFPYRVKIEIANKI